MTPAVPPRLVTAGAHRARVLDTCVFACLLIAAWFVNPDRPLPFDICLWKQVTGWPCLTCGLTRAVCHALHGHFATSVAYHPAGPVAAMALIVWTVKSALTLRAIRVR